MDKKMYIAMAALFVLVMGYYVYVEEIVRPKHPEWDWTGQNSQLAPEGGVSSAGQATTQTQPAGVAGAGGAAAAGGGEVRAVGAGGAGQSVLIGSLQPHDPDYALGLQISPTEAGLDSAVINDFKSADDKTLYSYQEPYGSDWSALGIRGVTLNGGYIDLTGVPWKVESSTVNSAVFGVDIVSNKNVPILHLTATYQIEPRGVKKNRDNTAAGYEVDVVYDVKNLSNTDQTVRISFDGPTMPPREAERQDDRQVVVAYDKGDQSLAITRYSATDFKPGSDSKDLTRNSSGYRFLWGGVTSLYFSAVVRPENEGQLDMVTASAQNPQDAPEDRRIAVSFQTAELKVAPGASADVPLKVLFAPKDRGMLEGDYYSAFPRGYNQLLVSTSGICGFCAFSWLVDFLVWLLGSLKWVLHDWGLAIIVLVIMVRLLLHPITKRSMVSTMKMQKMGPELERLKKKYGDDKDGFQKAQVQLYKEMGFTPVLGCLPMFLQMPIWIALYSALQNEIDLRQAPFLWGFTWIHDLARPDRLITWDAHAFTLPLVGKIAALNVLPILMGIGYFLQQKYTPKPPAVTPEQETQQKTMQWMTLLFPLFLYNAPSGLNLYILTSGALGALENKRIRDHIKQREEAEKAGKVFVDTKPTRQGKQKKQEIMQSEQRKSGRIATWWADLQQKMEEMRREAERRNKKDKK